MKQLSTSGGPNVLSSWRYPGFTRKGDAYNSTKDLLQFLYALDIPSYQLIKDSNIDRYVTRVFAKELNYE